MQDEIISCVEAEHSLQELDDKKSFEILYHAVDSISKYLYDIKVICENLEYIRPQRIVRGKIYISDIVTAPINRYNRKHLFLMSPTSVTIDCGEYGELALSAGIYTNIPFADSTYIRTSTPATTAVLFYSATDDMLP